MKGVYWLSLAAQTTEIWSEIFFKQQIANNQQHATDIYIDSLPPLLNQECINLISVVDIIQKSFHTYIL